MAEVIYVLCAATSVLCAVLLVRGFLRTQLRLLLWSSLCFVGFAVNSILLFVDLVLMPPQVDLAVWRSLAAFGGLVPLLYGLVWES
jgi:hypothetical protein